MTKKNLHIVHGEQSKATLLESNCVAAGSEEIVSFNELLSFGPLCDIDSTARIEARKLGLARILNLNDGAEDDIFSIAANHNSIQSILANQHDYNKIYLWLGPHTDEMITAARLLFHIEKLNIPIFKLDFSQGNFKNSKGAPIVLNSLRVMNVQNLQEIAPHFVEMDTGKIRSFAALWSTLRTNDSAIRIFDKNGELLEGDESFFDQYLLNRCTTTNQGSAYIVGCAMGDIWEDFDHIPTGDIFLFDRLNQLGRDGKIQISERREERGGILFQARLAESQTWLSL